MGCHLGGLVCRVVVLLVIWGFGDFEVWVGDFGCVGVLV